MQELTFGKDNRITQIDDEEYERCKDLYIILSKSKRKNPKIYAQIIFRVIDKNNKRTIKSMLLHRFILGIIDPKIFIDHIDGNPLNNQRSNLRIVTNQQNQFNQIKRPNTSSKYKGVSWYKRRNSWVATIRYNKKTYNLGYFKTEEEAALAYNEKASELFGKHARLNEIENIISKIQT